jgi:DNA-binding CsgD family transcriptional regulator
MLRGRQHECAAIDQLLGRARAGGSGVLVIRGRPGVGKTALLEYAIESASDLRVVRAAGVESEMELAFAALHQLCAPLLEWQERLPGPQRDVLRTTFGLSAGAVPDRFLVGLATLSLLAEVAEERPLVCVVDDAHCLDPASAQTLAFVARRLMAESIVLLFAAFQPTHALKCLPELVVEGLRQSDARELLRLVTPGRLDERVADQIVAETDGNPLALLELPRGLSPAQLAGGFGLPSALSLEGRIEESFLGRVEALPEDSQRLLAVAAAEPTGDASLLWRAAQHVGIDASAVEPVESAGLMEIGLTVRFRHPLVRSAVYRAAPLLQRREAHAALAVTTDADVDPDRRAWHLAQATAGPDEDVAVELERAAGRAEARGGLSAAAAFLERATALTSDPAPRARRALAAAQAKYEAGSFDEALALLAIVESNTVDNRQRARADLLRAEITFASRRVSEAPALLLKAARGLDAVDATLARSTYLEALAAALTAGRLSSDRGAREVSEATLAGRPPQELARPSDLLADGLALRFTKGYAAGAPILKQAIRAFRQASILPPQEARWLWLAIWIAGDLWDDETWTVLSTRELQRAREAGALAALPFVLTTQALLRALSGDLAAVASVVEELRAIAEATGIAASPYGALWLAALRGHEADATALINATACEAVSRGEGFAITTTEIASAVLYIGLGRYDAALEAARHAGERSDEIGSPTRGVADLVEAAVRCGERPLAERALERLAVTTRASGTEWALGIEARSRALLTEDDAAELFFRAAIEHLQRTRIRVDLARAHLLYGEWLRRSRRRADARRELRHAHTMFAAMGTDAFAERAARELRASGARARKRTVDTRDDLTPQERQIACLARPGLSNPEIAARLFITRRTVEYHLTNVFSKLGIRTRGQLGSVLTPEPEPVNDGVASAHSNGRRLSQHGVRG